jgi:hypothetical protein
MKAAFHDWRELMAHRRAATVAELTPWYQSCYLPPCY